MGFIAHDSEKGGIGAVVKRYRERDQLAADGILERNPSNMSVGLDDLLGMRPSAVVEVLRRLPDSEYQAIKQNKVWFLSPSQHAWGWNGRIPPDKSQVIYLSPNLEKLQRKDCVLAVAHEVTHSLLGHTDLKSTPEIENETWNKVEQLGFGSREEIQALRKLLGEAE